MKILDSQSFITINEQTINPNIIPIDDAVEIKRILSYLAKETKQYRINHEDLHEDKSSIFRKTPCRQCDELTKQLASLDISSELLKSREIASLLFEIFHNSIISYYDEKLNDELYVENRYKAWTDDGDDPSQGSYSTGYDMNVSFVKTLEFVSFDRYLLNTYNLKIVYDADSNRVIAYCDGTTIMGEPSDFDGEHGVESDEFFLQNNGVNLYDELKDIYEGACEYLQKYYDDFQ